MFATSKKSNPKSNPRKERLYIEMQYALRQYTLSLREYESMQNEYGTDSPIVTVFYAKLDHFRTEYYMLRLKYETDFGNVDEYKNSVHRFRQWSDDRGIHLLMKPVLMRWQPRHRR